MLPILPYLFTSILRALKAFFSIAEVLLDASLSQSAKLIALNNPVR
jgi:hypothetical protein